MDHPVIRYAGGKWRLAKWIISQFPDHHTYVEPFCGAASVLLQKEPSYFEVLNDLDDDIINFFKVLREDTERFIHAVELTPWSREECRISFEQSDDKFEAARRFYVRHWQGRSASSITTGWRFQRSVKESHSIVQQWNAPDYLWKVVERLKYVQIEHDDALSIIKRFDTPDTLFYVDPPYVLDTRYGRMYRHEYQDDDHKRLLDILKCVKGKVVLSGYESDLYDLDWNKTYKSSKTNGNIMRREVLWKNFT